MLEMGNTVYSIIKKIEAKYKWTFGGTCLIGLLTHLFMFTNLLPGNDQTVFYFNLGNTLPFGRWGLYLLEIPLPIVETSIVTCFGMPWVKGLISICLLATVACIVVSVLEIKNTSICLLTGMAIVTFPSVAAILSYMFTSTSYFLGLLLSCLAVYLAKKSFVSPKWIFFGGGVGTSVLTMLSLSIYQSFVCFAIGLLVAELLLYCINKQTTFICALKKCLYYLWWLIFGITLYYLSVKIMVRWTGITLSSYRGIGNVLGGGLRDIMDVIFGGIGIAYKSFFDMPFLMSETLKYRRVLYLCIGLMAVVEIIIIVWSKKIYTSIKMILCLVLIALLPVATGSVYLMGATIITTLMQYGMVVPTLLALALAQQFCDTIKQKRKKGWNLAYYITCISVLMLSYQYYLITNEAYNRQFFTYEQTYGFMNRVAYEIQSCEGYTMDTPVMLQGNTEKAVVMPEFNKLDTISGIFGESALVNGYTREEFIRRYCGLPIVRAGDLMRTEILLTKEYADMPLYPAPGSVKIINGCCVVKFSE